MPAHLPSSPHRPCLLPQTDTRTIGPTSTAQTLLYSAPEMLQVLMTAGRGAVAVKRTADGDVFAYAMTLYELMTG